MGREGETLEEVNVVFFEETNWPVMSLTLTMKLRAFNFFQFVKIFVSFIHSFLSLL